MLSRGGTMISAEEWYRMFVEEFERAAEDTNTEIGILYEKFAVLESWGFEVRDLSTDWTHCMSVFLARMARKRGYLQDWEFQNTDLCWLQKNRTDPTIAIEHENIPAGIGESEILSLLRVEAPLKILITYTTVSGDTNLVLDEARLGMTSTPRTARQPFEFLLIVGIHPYEPSNWKGYLWNDRTGNWQEVIL
jgi:hypothetical protein